MSKQQFIAQNMINILKKNNRTCIWYGDIELIEQCASLSNLPLQHPQKTIATILNALDHSSNFKKGYITSDINGIPRKYRCFTLKC